MTKRNRSQWWTESSQVVEGGQWGLSHRSVFKTCKSFGSPSTWRSMMQAGFPNDLMVWNAFPKQRVFGSKPAEREKINDATDFMIYPGNPTTISPTSYPQCDWDYMSPYKSYDQMILQVKSWFWQPWPGKILFL